MNKHYVYLIETPLSEKYYVGKTTNYERRWLAHKFGAISKLNTPVYAWMRKYGRENFEMVLVAVFDNKEDADKLEIKLISESPHGLNVHGGGGSGYSMSDDPRNAEWRANLSKARQGAKPALGMKHTDSNKEIFSVSGKKRWDIYGRYPEEVLSHSFIEANKKYGISKTQYYRLRRAKLSREL